jgi:ABC-type transport system involved in cytochrome bd biosynthesis fused ATPase/permease subunit
VWAKGKGWVWEEKAKGKGLEGGEREKQNEEEHAHEPDEPSFVLHDITLSIPRGTLAAVVGRVGSGMSSLLQGLVGEMQTTDTVTGTGPSGRLAGAWRGYRMGLW